MSSNKAVAGRQKERRTAFLSIKLRRVKENITELSWFLVCITAAGESKAAEACSSEACLAATWQSRAGNWAPVPLCPACPQNMGDATNPTPASPLPGHLSCFPPAPLMRLSKTTDTIATTNSKKLKVDNDIGS